MKTQVTSALATSGKRIGTLECRLDGLLGKRDYHGAVQRAVRDAEEAYEMARNVFATKVANLFFTKKLAEDRLAAFLEFKRVNDNGEGLSFDEASDYDWVAFCDWLFVQASLTLSVLLMRMLNTTANTGLNCIEKICRSLRPVM